MTVAAAAPVREGAGLAGQRALVSGDPAIAAPGARTLRDRYGHGGLETTRSPLHGWGAEERLALVVSR